MIGPRSSLVWWGGAKIERSCAEQSSSSVTTTTTRSEFGRRKPALSSDPWPFVLTAVGVMIGLVGALAASRIVVSLLYGVSPFDPLTYCLVIAVLTAVSGVASSMPAWRAARVDPAITLRAE